MVNAHDIVRAAYTLLGAPSRLWRVGNSMPMWLDDSAGDPPPVTHLHRVGVMGSDLVNYARRVNGLPPGGGTGTFGDYLVNTFPFDLSSPGQAGAIALRPYSGPAREQQGHIALYVDEHKLIQALSHGEGGVTDLFTDEETYLWSSQGAPQYGFTVYGFLPGVSYERGWRPEKRQERRGR